MAKVKSESTAAVQTKKKVKSAFSEFTLEMPDASAVYLAADFNQWNGDEQPMKKDKKGVWKTRVKLEPGAYQYKFVVDGKWIEDPANPNTEKDPFGGDNSVKIVE